MDSAKSSDDSEEEQEFEIVSKEIRDAAKQVSFELLPKISKQLYVKAYNNFKKWRREKGSNSFCEDVMLAYFGYLTTRYKPPSLWPIYSMLKSTISAFHQVDIRYQRLIQYIKAKNDGYESVKSPVFTEQQISKFLNEAPNQTDLCVKVILIFGIFGAMRRGEFAKLLNTDVVDIEGELFVKINQTKNKRRRRFSIAHVGLYEICKEYMKTRPSPCSSDRFFLTFRDGKYKQQAIGINTSGSTPRKIAKYLELPDAQLFKGHSLRRTSATLLVNAGANVFTLMRHGGWLSVKAAEGYVAESVSNKRKICDQITSGIALSKKPNLQSVSKSTSGKQVETNRLHVQSRSNSNSNQVKNNTLHNNNSAVNLKSSDTIETELLRENASGNKAVQVQRFDDNSNVMESLENVTSNQNEIQVVNSKQSSSGTPQTEPTSVLVKKYPVYYHPDVGLYGLECTDDDLTLVFCNCNIKIGEGSYKFIVLNNCKINL